jgi:oligopeptide/dipeptide ABC transporter ATP-binding protein
MKDIVLDIQDLRTYFQSKDGCVKAVDGVSYQLYRRKTLGLVGESGCGKSVTALSILRLLDMPPAEIKSGQILFKDQDLLGLSETGIQAVRGKDISMIFQEPMTSLNPLQRVGSQISEVIWAHKKMNARQIRERVREILTLVGIPSPEKRMNDYPHQLSGGMRQRIMIAIALACDPKVLIADEPTTALDVTIQAQILGLLKDLQDKLGTSILIITHDLGVIAETAHNVAVMYAGKVVEIADVKTIFKQPLHPYTQGLLRSVPKVDETGPRHRLKEIPGTVPNLWNLPPGCSFLDRCPVSLDKCADCAPGLTVVNDQHKVRCWNAKIG